MVNKEYKQMWKYWIIQFGDIYEGPNRRKLGDCWRFGEGFSLVPNDFADYLLMFTEWKFSHDLGEFLCLCDDGLLWISDGAQCSLSIGRGRYQSTLVFYLQRRDKKKNNPDDFKFHFLFWIFVCGMDLDSSAWNSSERSLLSIRQLAN